MGRRYRIRKGKRKRANSIEAKLEARVKAQGDVKDEIKRDSQNIDQANADNDATETNAVKTNESDDDFYIVPANQLAPKVTKEKKSTSDPQPEVQVKSKKKTVQKQAPRNDIRVPVIYKVPNVCPPVPKSPENKKKRSKNKTKDSLPNTVECLWRESSLSRKDNKISMKTINGSKPEEKKTKSKEINSDFENSVVNMEKIIHNYTQEAEKNSVTNLSLLKDITKVCGAAPTDCNNTAVKIPDTQSSSKNVDSKLNHVPEKYSHISNKNNSIVIKANKRQEKTETNDETKELQTSDSFINLRDSVMVKTKRGKVPKGKNKPSISETIEKIKHNMKVEENEDVEKLPVPNACQLSDLVPDEQHQIHKVVNSRSEDVMASQKSTVGSNATEVIHESEAGDAKKSNKKKVKPQKNMTNKKEIMSNHVLNDQGANSSIYGIKDMESQSEQTQVVSKSTTLDDDIHHIMSLVKEEFKTAAPASVSASEVIYDEPIRSQKLQKTRANMLEIRKLLSEAQIEIVRSDGSEVIYDKPVIGGHLKKKVSNKKTKQRSADKNSHVDNGATCTLSDFEIPSSDDSIGESDGKVFKNFLDSDFTASDLFNMAIKLSCSDEYAKKTEEGGVPMLEMNGFDEFFKQEIADAFKKTGGNAKTALESINMHDLILKFGRSKLETVRLYASPGVAAVEKFDDDKMRKSNEKCDENKNIINGNEATNSENSTSDLSERVNYNDSDNESITSVSQQVDDDVVYDEICEGDKLTEDLENLEIDITNATSFEAKAEFERQAQREYEEMMEFGVSQNKKRKTDEQELTDRDIDLDEIVLDELCHNLEQILQDDTLIENEKSDLSDKDETIAEVTVGNEIGTRNNNDNLQQLDDDGEINEAKQIETDGTVEQEQTVNVFSESIPSKLKTFMNISQANEYGYISYLTRYRLKFPTIIFVNNRLPKMGCGLTPMFYDNDIIGQTLILQDPELLRLFNNYPVHNFNEFPVSYVITLGRFLVRKIPIDVNEVVVASFAECLVSKELRKPVSSQYAIGEFVQAVHGLMSIEGQDYGMPGSEAYDEYIKMLTNSQPVQYKSPFDPLYYNDLEALFFYVLFVARTKAYCQFSILDMHILCAMCFTREGYVPDTLMLQIVESLDRVGYTVQITNIQIGLYYKRYGHSTMVHSLISKMKYVFDEYHRDFKEVMAVLKDIPNSFLTCFLSIGKAIKFFADFRWASIMLLCKKEWHNYTLAVISLNGIDNIEPPCLYTSNYNNYPHLAYAAQQILIRVGREPTLEYYGGWDDLSLKYKEEIDKLVDNYIIYKNTDAPELLKVEHITQREAREYETLTNLLHGYVYVRTLLPMDFECDLTFFKSKALEQEREWLQLMRAKTVLKLRYFSCPHSTSYNYEELLYDQTEMDE